MVPFDAVPLWVLLLQCYGSLTCGPGPGFAGCPGGHRAGETWHPEPCVICTCQVRESAPATTHIPDAGHTPGLAVPSPVWGPERAAATPLQPARPTGPAE